MSPERAVFKHGGPEALSPDMALLRNEPVQARSAARLATLLDSAAAVIGEIGYERLTTAMVAERAGASIGTVYRYFPDRIVVLQGVSARFLQEFSESTSRVIQQSKEASWLDAVDSCLDDIVAAFRRQPGFRSLRFGDVLDIGTDGESGTGTIAASMAGAVAERYSVTPPDLAFHLEVALSLADALLARAFRKGGKGDDRFIAKARSVARDYLVGVYGDEG
ncbi:MAG: TetR/AcrR family transcriptional regulator [Microbacteriaceae bacterium]|jgi:AcrR family transcriptional regulator|nr:TetR/AcrR family transcriptional regulator [Microbacteriaceae bacterium]